MGVSFLLKAIFVVCALEPMNCPPGPQGASGMPGYPGGKISFPQQQYIPLPEGCNKYLIKI